jgi:hypothetical protein
MQGPILGGWHARRPLTVWLRGYAKRDIAGADHLMEETGSSWSRSAPLEKGLGALDMDPAV